MTFTTPALSDFAFKVSPVQEKFSGCDNPLPKLPEAHAERGPRERIPIFRAPGLRNFFVP